MKKDIFPIGGIFLIISGILSTITYIIFRGELNIFKYGLIHACQFLTMSGINFIFVGIFELLKKNKIMSFFLAAEGLIEGYIWIHIFKTTEIYFYKLLLKTAYPVIFCIALILLAFVSVARFAKAKKDVMWLICLMLFVIYVALGIFVGHGFQIIGQITLILGLIMTCVWVNKPQKEIRNKQSNNMPEQKTNQVTITPEELLKFKKLLDDGVITQEDFEVKKKYLI